MYRKCDRLRSMSLVEAIKEIQGQIKAKKQEVKTAQAELEELEAELEGARLLLKNSSSRRRRRSSNKRAFSSQPEIPYKLESSVGRAVEVLREAKHPLRIDELIQAIRGHGYEVNKGTLVGNLSRYVKEQKIFFKPERSRYGLVEWQPQEAGADMTWN